MFAYSAYTGTPKCLESTQKTLSDKIQFDLISLEEFIVYKAKLEIKLVDCNKWWKIYKAKLKDKITWPQK